MEERRRYFRLDDEVILDFEAISHDEARHWKERQQDHRNELAELDRDIAGLLHQMQAQNPVVAQLFDLFNRKINLVNSPLKSSEKSEHTATEVRTRVNLSACGMAFHTREPLSENDNLRLQMQLKPSNVPVTLMGTVVGIENTGDANSPYLVRINFEGLREAEQEILIHHLFQLQSRQLKMISNADNDES
ncbi:MAG: PilZ domain-containing protein [Thalassolituus sp.]